MAGHRPALHRCACQKQPCTKMATLCFGKTMSGVPGRSMVCSLNRKPSACSARRKTISGVVCRCFTDDMRALRSRLVRMSVMRGVVECGAELHTHID